jgi:hypothetical protein
MLAASCGDAGVRAPSSTTDASRPASTDGARAGLTDGSHADAPDSSRTTACNGHAELCGRAYDQVTFPGTHDSYSDTSEGFLAPAQTYPIARQLADGIRVLHFEVHVYEGAVYVCHSLCAIGSRLLSDEMSSISSFVVAHPDDVVTLLLERSDATIAANDIGGVMKASGLVPFLHVQPVGAPWPTLGEMIQKGETLVAFLDNTAGSSETWLLPRWQLTWETPWDNTTPADFGDCSANRGTMGDGVYVVDTYMEDLIIETAAHAALVNYDPFLIERLVYCKRATSTLPNFAMVNFYEVSDIFAAVDMLNGFTPTPDLDLGAFPPSDWPSDGGLDAPDGGHPPIHAVTPDAAADAIRD